MRRFALPLACVSLAMALSTLSTRSMADPRSIPPPTFPAPFGVNIHYTTGQPGETAKLARAYKVARMDFVWSGTEKKRGEYDFSPYDGLLKELEANGVTPLFILDYGNDLYQAGPPRTEEARTAYARWAAAAAARYKGHRIMWEFWNEPNGNGFWGGKPDPWEYARLVNDAAAAMRKADPHCTLLIGALSGFAWEFVEVMKMSGNYKWADAFSVHPYRASAPETAGADYTRLKRILHGGSPQREIPIISGEWGYPSAGRTETVDETRQAQYLVRQRLFNAAHGIRTSIWYDWKEDGPDPNEREHHFGSVHMDLTPKPAYTAALTCTETLAGYDFVRMLEDGPTSFVMLLRNKEGESALALWTTGETRRYRVRGPVRRVVEMLGASRAGKDNETISYGPSPVYALLGKNEDLDARAAWTWLSPNAIVDAGRSTETTFTITNTGSEARTFDVTLSLDGGTVRPEKVKLSLRPDEVRRVPVTLTLWQRAQQTNAGVRVTSSGGPAGTVKDSTRIPLVVTNPITLSADLGQKGFAAVTVEAPDVPGRSTSETLNVQITGPDGRPEGKSLPLAMDPKDRRRGIARLPLDMQDGRADFGVRVTDKAGHEVASLSPSTFKSLYTFEADRGASAPKGLSLVPDGDPNVASSGTMTIAVDPKRGPVLDLRATFADGWKFFRITPKETAIPDDVVEVGVWVNGDNSNDAVRCRFIDAKGQVYQPYAGQVLWKGWKFVTMRLDDPTVGSWGGPQDGVIHRPIRWDTILLLDNSSQKAHATHLQFDDITLISRSGRRTKG